MDKKCSVCGEEKPFSEFNKRSRSSDGHRAQCRPCQIEYNKEYYSKNLEYYKKVSRKSRLKRIYGLTLSEYEDMMVDHDYKCAICFSEPDGKNLDIDHCHASGEVRGLLCSNCNRGIGHLQESPDIMKSAIEYLKKYSR